MMWRKKFFTAVLLMAAALVRGNDVATTQPARAVVEVRMIGSREPVAGVNVAWETNAHLKGSAQTGASGECTIDGIPNQTRLVTIHVSRDGMVPEVNFWGLKGANSLPRSPRILFLLEKGGRISGHAIDDSGKPIAGAEVFLNIRKKYEGSEQWVDLNWHSTKTDSEGLWSFTGIPDQPDKLGIGGYELMHLSGEFFDTEEYKPRSALWDGTARLTLPVGTVVDIHVLKPDGTPAGGADVVFGRETGYVNSTPPAKSDAQGNVRFGFKPGTSSLLTASLQGYGPVQQNFSVGEQPKHLTLKLTGATTRKIEVVDSRGNPIRGATVMISKWRGSKVFDVQLDTDKTGGAIWNNGPADDVTADVDADGFVGKRDVTWSADKLVRVALSQPTTVTGRVVDAQTGEPIKSYTIRASAVWRADGRPVWQNFDWLKDQGKKREGQFDLELTRPAYRYLLRVQSDGYLPEDTGLFDPDGSAKSFEFRLKRAAPVAGKIILAEDKPVAGADVYLVISGDWLGLANGKIGEGHEDDYAHVKSGEDGRFAIPPQKEDFAIVVLSDFGMAIVKRDEMAGKLPTIQLAPWAKMRGTIRVNGKLAADIQVSGSGDATMLGDGSTVVSRQYYFETDHDGNFELPRVAPERTTLTRQVENRSPGRMWFIGLASIDAKPGENYDVKLGEGVSVTGRLVIPSGEQWMVRQSRMELKGKPHVENWENVEVMDDGSFHADGLAAGEYVLHIALHEFPPNNDCGWGRLVGEYDKDILISNGIQNLDIGTLSPERIPGPDLKVGDLAPDFAAKNLDGQITRLKDLRGKVVLVDFWAEWCAPCVAEIPNMRKIKSAYLGSGKFVMMGLSIDDGEEDFRSFVKRAKIDWPQAWVGINSETVKAYGATAVPASFLIGPDGRIVARDLRGEELQKAVGAAVGK